MRIIAYRRMDDIDVLFMNGYNEVKTTRYEHFKSGMVKCKTHLLGKTSTNKFGDTCTAIEVVGERSVRVRFADGGEKTILNTLFTRGFFPKYHKVYSLDNTKEIPGHKGYYADKGGNVYNKKGWKLTQSEQGAYYCVSLPTNAGIKNFNVHRLIALTFLPTDPNRNVVNHKDGNKHNNKLSNLEWVTDSENQIHSVVVLRKAAPKGTVNGMHKLTENDVKEIRRLHEVGCSYSTIAKKYNVSVSNISSIINKRSWTCI